MIVPALPVYTPVGDPHGQRAVQTERYDRISGDSDGPASHITPVDGSHDGSYDAAVRNGFHPVGIGRHPVALAIDRHRFQIEDQVVIGSYTDNDFRLSATR